MPPAPARSRPRPARRLSWLVLGTFAVLLCAPALALWRLGHLIDPRILAVWLAVINAATWLTYRSDKRRAAIAGERRTPEVALHCLEFLGGWPAAFLAQRQFRHKIVKARFQAAYWIIVLLQEYAAFDCFADWKYSLAGLTILVERAREITLR